jgi:hypothetical protein
LIHRNAPVLIFPAKAGTHFSHGHRLSPVWREFDMSLGPFFPSESSEWI